MSTDLATIPDVPSQNSAPALSNLRQAMMTLTPEVMQRGLAEFSERRETFRRWLLAQLVEGVHFGFPPGCKPAAGIDKREWKPKQSLYKAGADFLVELLGWRCEFTNDIETWEMLGKPPTVCIKCVIRDGHGAEVGQGRGARQRGTKKMDDNGTVKMAEKCAKVDAVIHALSLSDLFTQDEPPDPRNSPDADPNAVRQAPRSKRVTIKDVDSIRELWKTNNADANWNTWRDFVHRASNCSFDVRSEAAWTFEIYERVRDAVNCEVFGDSRSGDEPY